MELKEVGTCCLCGGVYDHFGHNPAPVATGKNDRCCDVCNDLKVVPARLANYYKRHAND